MRLGIVNVQRDIFKGLTAEQLLEWQAYDEVEPLEMIEDYRIAAVVQMLYNVNRASGSRSLTIKEFVDAMRYERQRVHNEGEQPTTQQTPQQQFSMLQVLAAMHANDSTPIVTAPGVEPSQDQIARALESAKKAMH